MIVKKGKSNPKIAPEPPTTTPLATAKGNLPLLEGESDFLTAFLLVETGAAD
jgi:hypothetical protein